jgi:hypothetical protein
MTLRFVGIDPETDRDHCSTVWVDTESKELVVQGWKASAALVSACEATSPANGPVPDEEAIVRIPARMKSIISDAFNVIDSDVR